MHELPIIKKILNIVLARARENQVTHIKTIFLKIGARSELEEEWMQRYFEYLSSDTPAASARLHIERIPVEVQCLGCKQRFELNVVTHGKQICPACGSETYRLIAGKGYFIESMEAY